MPSRSFVVQKLICREFEQALALVFELRGARVIDVDDWGYKHKKGRDKILEINGERASLEAKLDVMSEKTNRVCIDLDSLSKTQSKYWVFGLPKQGKIEVYAMYAYKLKDFVREYSKHPGALQKVGEFKQYCLFVPKLLFINLPFISKFKTIELQQD